jgi:hypothetical protein
MPATPGRNPPALQPAPYSRPTAAAGPAAPPRPARNALRLGPRTRRVIRSVARLVNPLVLRIAGRFATTVRAALRDAGVVDEHGEPAIRLDLREGGGDGGVVGDIELDEACAELLGRGTPSSRELM